MGEKDRGKQTGWGLRFGWRFTRTQGNYGMTGSAPHKEDPSFGVKPPSKAKMEGQPKG